MRIALLAAFAAASVVCGPVACGSGQGDAPAPTVAAAPTSPTRCLDSAKYPPLPSPVDLNAKIQRGLDPNVPIAEKVALVQRGELDPSLFDKFANRIKTSNGTIEVVGIEELCGGKANAVANVTLNGQPNNGSKVPIVADGGTWKVDGQWVCNLLGALKVPSPACGT